MNNFPAHWISMPRAHPRVLPSGVMTVFYFNQLIALINDRGKIVWRNPFYPVFLVEYLIENPPPQYRWN